jgi:hypothetical protein
MSFQARAVPAMLLAVTGPLTIKRMIIPISAPQTKKLLPELTSAGMSVAALTVLRKMIGIVR